MNNRWTGLLSCRRDRVNRLLRACIPTHSLTLTHKLLQVDLVYLGIYLYFLRYHTQYDVNASKKITEFNEKRDVYCFDEGVVDDPFDDFYSPEFEQVRGQYSM